MSTPSEYPIVVITVEEGLVDIRDASQVSIRIYDYDIEGADDSDLSVDDQGIPCFVREEWR